MPKYPNAMNDADKFADLLRTYEQDWEFVLETSLLNIAEQIAREMEARRITKAELANRMGVSRAYITQLLRGDTNISIGTLFKVTASLNLQPTIQLKRRDVFISANFAKLELKSIPTRSLTSTINYASIGHEKEYQPASYA
jgi:transcriptional regulator with XRE-family HTH domain